MTITYGLPIMKGVSGDTKPTTNLDAGYYFFETDTHKLFYWDGSAWSGAAAAPMTFGGARTPTPAATAYQSLYQSSVSTAGSAEANATTPLNFTFIPFKLSVKVSSNTLNGNTIISFRDDGTDVTNSAVTIASTDAGGTLKESSAINASVASGSLVCWKVDASASSTGTAVFSYVIQGYAY